MIKLILKLKYLILSIETMVLNKIVSYGFASSWKAAANYMKEAANVDYFICLYVLMSFKCSFSDSRNCP